jgi:protein TonB
MSEALRSSPLVDPDGRDPLRRMLALGERSARTGLAVGFAIATLAHAAGAARVLSAPIELQRWAAAARATVHEHLWTVYDVEVVQPEKPAQPEPPKEEPKDEAPPPAPAPRAPSAPKAPANAPPPAAAQAGKVLTAAPDPNEPVDLTGQGFVTGNAETYAGGVTAANGTATTAVRDQGARGDGVGAGKGTTPAALPAGPDRSRPAGVSPGSNWSSCPFPAEADADQIDFQLVTIMVTVRPDGSAQSVKVVNDPGHGFGRAARQCALGQRFVPALDREGNPVLASTPPISVRFTR